MFAYSSDKKKVEKVKKEYEKNLKRKKKYEKKSKKKSPPPEKKDVETSLKTLNDLKSKGLITEEEYNAQRKRILNDL